MQAALGVLFTLVTGLFGYLFKQMNDRLANLELWRLESSKEESEKLTRIISDLAVLTVKSDTLDRRITEILLRLDK